MLRGPISNLGVRGMRRAAKAVAKWPGQMAEEELRDAAYNGFIFIDAEGGTGGGMFRYMYSRFLREAADICGCPELEVESRNLGIIGDAWQEVALIFQAAAQAKDPGAVLGGLPDMLHSIADREQAVWEVLDGLCAASS